MKRRSERRSFIGSHSSWVVLECPTAVLSVPQSWNFGTYLKMDSNKCLVRGICGSLIRSNGARKLGSRSWRTRCRWASAISVASCLSNQFDLPGKRYAAREDQSSAGLLLIGGRNTAGGVRQLVKLRTDMVLTPASVAYSGSVSYGKVIAVRNST
jgi:hypothetical protein